MQPFLLRKSSCFLKWSLRQILEWKISPTVSCPVFHVHGSLDRILPAKLTRPDVLIEGGGHVISITHSKQVNAFIRLVLFGETENR
jgi:pimeloyl-ACP methyl ester carboxylesterase